jgi:hypothetical protein
MSIFRYFLVYGFNCIDDVRLTGIDAAATNDDDHDDYDNNDLTTETRKTRRWF